VVGYGRAEKPQVQRMITLLLGLPKPPAPFDVADALAVAMCHLHRAHPAQPAGPRPEPGRKRQPTNWRRYKPPSPRT